MMIMKSLKIFTSVLLVSTLFLMSCNKDDDSTSKNTQEQIISNVSKGTWRITKFIDSDQDEIYHFNGYNLTFQKSGVLVANNGTNNYEGTWNISGSSSNDDSQNDIDFNIFFNLANKFEDLNDDWDIVSFSATKIELIDISGGNGGTDYLTFERN